MDKSYDGFIQLGRATTTFDREGEAVGPDRDSAGVRREADRGGRRLLPRRVPPVSPGLLGEEGRAAASSTRWRERARACPLMPKKVRVKELRFGELSGGRLPFTISCSSGTYIRSIASELGEMLGCGAHLESLRRVRIGDFHVRDAVALERFEEMSPADRLAPPHAVPLSRVHFPVRAGAPRVARDLEDPQGTVDPGPRRRLERRGLGGAGGTLRRDGGARPGEPDRHAGNRAHPAEAGAGGVSWRVHRVDCGGCRSCRTCPRGSLC